MRNSAMISAWTIVALAAGTVRALAQATYEPYTFLTLAGLPGIAGTADGTGSAAQFSGPPYGGPQGLAVDGAGNVYVADTGNFTIRKVTPAGLVTTLAGMAGNFGSADGTGTAARFSSPVAVAVDSAGNVFVGDYTAIRKVTPAGVVTTLAGGSYGSADGMGSAARFAAARSLALDAGGNIYVADTGNYTIRKVTPIGTNWAVTTLAGLSGQPGKADGVGSAARFGTSAFGGGPSGLAVDSANNVYVVDRGNGTIRKLTQVGTNWVVTTLAGPGIGGGVDGIGIAARFYDPLGVAVDSAGNTYITESSGGTIRKITPAGAVTTLAGQWGYSGSADGTGNAARFRSPSGVAVDSAGNVYVADSAGSTIRKGLSAVGPPVILTQPRSQTVVAGITSVVLSPVINGTPPLAYQWFKNGVYIAGATNSSYSLNPVGSLDAGIYSVLASNLYGIVTSSEAMLTITPQYPFITLAGSPWEAGSADGTGSAAQFWEPGGVAVDSAGNVYVADTINNAIRKVTPLGVVTTLAGLAPLDPNENPVALDGTGSAARFNRPSGVAVDSAGNVFVADTGNQTIRKVTPTGEVTTLAGLANHRPVPGQNGDGTGSAARFSSPAAVAVDSPGAVFVADSSAIRKMTLVGTNWVVTTVAGLAGTHSSTDATGASARFNVPQGIAVDSAGNVYVADTFNATIRKVTPVGTNWVVTTLAGGAGFEGRADGTGNAARFGFPYGVAVDSSGNVYVADHGSSTIRKVTPAGAVTTLAGEYAPSGIAVDTAGNIYLADSGNDTIRKGFPPVGPPVIFTEPSDSSLERNADVILTFSIVANGAAPLAFQWFKDGLSITGATNSSFALRNIQPTDDGVYRVVVTNALGSAMSSNAVLTTFVRPPEILMQPQNQIEEEGYDFTFQITATGTEPLEYQWRKNGADIAGATNANFSVFNIQGVDAGVYSVVLSNAYGTLTSSNAVLSLTLPYTFITLAGLAGSPGSVDATGSAARFSNPSGMALDEAGNVYVADSGNNTIRKVTPAGVVTTLAGLALFDKQGSAIGSSADGVGNAARFNSPAGVAVDTVGNVYVADSGNDTVRKITPAGIVTTFAGQAGSSGSADGTGSTARFQGPEGVAVDSAGNVYVADSGNNTIRKITPSGIVTTLAGLAGSRGRVDGTGTAARFGTPRGVAVDSTGNLFVAETYNNTIRKVRPVGTNWIVTTLAGLFQTTDSGDPWGSNADGIGSAARFNQPFGLAVDAADNVYLADTDNNLIRKVTPEGMVITLAGLSRDDGRGADGTGSHAHFDHPNGIAVDGAGNLYVADTFNSTLRKGFPASVILNSGQAFGFKGSRFGFTFVGPARREVVVEASSDLMNWLPIFTNSVATNLNFSDPQTGIYSKRFYRTRTP